MNELLLATNRPLTPVAVIQGAVENLGMISGLSIRSVASTKFAHRNGKVYFGVGGRVGVNGGYSGDVQVLDVATLVAKVLGNDYTFGDTDRQIEVSADGTELYLYGGKGGGSTIPSAVIMDAVTGARKITYTSSTYQTLNYAHGFYGKYGKRIYMLGANGTTGCYRFDYNTNTQVAFTAPVPGSVSGTQQWYGVTVGSVVYMYNSTGGSIYRFDMEEEKFLTGSYGTGSQVWSEGAYDGARYIYFLSGSTTSLPANLVKYDTVTNTKVFIPLTGAKPTGLAYYTKDAKFFWYNNALYFFRSDTDTNEGKSLFRIT